jgi:hypothetical protein
MKSIYADVDADADADVGVSYPVSIWEAYGGSSVSVRRSTIVYLPPTLEWDDVCAFYETPSFSWLMDLSVLESL